MNRSDTHLQPHSIMIVSDRASFSEDISAAFPATENHTVTTKNESFQTMNGRAVSFAFDHDIVIFETDPDDLGEVQAIEALLSKRSGNTMRPQLHRANRQQAKRQQPVKLPIQTQHRKSNSVDRARTQTGPPTLAIC